MKQCFLMNLISERSLHSKVTMLADVDDVRLAVTGRTRYGWAKLGKCGRSLSGKGFLCS